MTLAVSLAAGVGFFALGYVGVMLPRAGNHVTPIWLSNGLVVACLLSVDTRRWPYVLGAAFISGVLFGVYAGDRPLISLILTMHNVLQSFASAWAVRRTIGDTLDLGRPRDVFAFVGFGGVLAPLLTSAPASLIYTSAVGGDPWVNMAVWALGDILGVLIVTPFILVLLNARRYLSERPLSWDGLAAILTLVAVTIAVFAQSRYPLLFLIPPMMLIVAARLEVLGGVVGATLVAVVATGMTTLGMGPINIFSSTPHEQSIIMQLFLAVSVFVSLPVAALERQRRGIHDRMAQVSEAVARSEARYRLLTETARDMIAHSDLSGRVTYVSPAAEAVTGYPVEELLGRRLFEIIHPEDVGRVLDAARVQARGEGAVESDNLEYRAFRKDGAVIWLESRPTLARDPVSGEVVGVTDIVRDVSARKALETELREAQARAEAAATAKGEFLANMSHELRTPLTAVIGFADLVDAEADLDPQTRRHVGRIVNGGRALLATINDILDFSKLEAGHIEIKPRPAPVAELVAEILDIFALKASTKGLSLTATGLEALPERLLLDPERLRQVLLNLIGNAIKFTETGGVTLELDYDPAAQALRVGVVDTGQGIAAEDLDLLFMRFSQVDASISRVHGGTGLGLAISKGLVEAMGGRIGVESVRGRGSRFFIDLPAQVQARGEPDAPVEAPVLPSGAHILVVDDNAANRELARAVLEAFGVGVVEAVDGEEAVEAARDAAFDVILMDLRMPRLDGVQAAEKIRAEGGLSAQAPIIAFSADARQDAPAKVFDGAVAKPMTAQALIAAIAAVLERSRTEG